MGCGCGGSGTALIRGARQLDAGVSTTQWEVTYPNSTIRLFPQQWQAAQAVALSGGSVREIRPDRSGDPDTPGEAPVRAGTDRG